MTIRTYLSGYYDLGEKWNISVYYLSGAKHRKGWKQPDVCCHRNKTTSGHLNSSLFNGISGHPKDHLQITFPFSGPWAVILVVNYFSSLPQEVRRATVLFEWIRAHLDIPKSSLSYWVYFSIPHSLSLIDTHITYICAYTEVITFSFCQILT